MSNFPHLGDYATKGEAEDSLFYGTATVQPIQGQQLSSNSTEIFIITINNICNTRPETATCTSECIKPSVRVN